MKLVKQPHGGAIVHAEKGDVMNPKGKPKGTKNRATIARETLELIALPPDELFAKLLQRYPGLKKNMSVEEMMSLMQADKAISKRDTYAYNALLDSAYGKPKQDIDHTTGGQAIPATINIIVKKVASDEGE